MIEPAVQAEYRKFLELWTPRVAVSPVLALDGSWFSFGVVDALTWPLRGNADPSPFERELRRGAAAYIAVKAAECWAAFGAESSVEYRDTGVVIRALSGPGIESGEEGFFHVERDLGELLEKLPRPMPLFSTFAASISPVDNLVSPFAFALFTGLLVSGEGPWENETIESFSEQIDTVVRHLAVGCSEAYARLFPDESLGQVPELYLRGLIYPLTLMSEAMPVRSAVKGLFEFAEEYKVRKPALLKLCTNLASVADQRVSQAGFVAAAALADEPSVEIYAKGYLWGPGTGLLYGALREARERAGLGGSWLDKPELVPGDLDVIRKEIRLGFFPWLKLPPERIVEGSGDATMRQLLRSLVEFNMPQSVLLIDRLIELTPDDFDLRIQRVYLYMVNAELDKAETGLKNLLTEHGSETRGQLYNLLGVSQITKRKLDTAEMYLKKAQNLTASYPQFYAEACNNLGWLSLTLGKLDQALDAFDESLRMLPDSVPALLNRSVILSALKRFEEAASVTRRLFALSPLERSLFQREVYQPAAKSHGN